MVNCHSFLRFVGGCENSPHGKQLLTPLKKITEPNHPFCMIRIFPLNVILEIHEAQYFWGECRRLQPERIAGFISSSAPRIIWRRTPSAGVYWCFLVQWRTEGAIKGACQNYSYLFNGELFFYQEFPNHLIEIVIGVIYYLISLSINHCYIGVIL